jgi:hypothetical protein
MRICVHGIKRAERSCCAIAARIRCWLLIFLAPIIESLNTVNRVLLLPGEVCLAVSNDDFASGLYASHDN